MKTLIWAHRGASAYAPENTLEAFELAAKMGADGIELDIHRSKDGVIVVSHDGTIGRCAKDGSGEISQQTYAELSRYNYNNGMEDKYPHCSLPTLDDVYKLLKSTDLTINVEIKHGGIDFIRSINECTLAHGMADRVVYSSFDHKALCDMKSVNADTFCAPLHGTGIEEPWNYAKTLGSQAIHPIIWDVYSSPDYVKKAHEAGIRVHVWTVDDEENIKRLIDLGVDAIITNKPDIALKCLKEG